MTLEQQEQIRKLRASGEGYKRISVMLGLSLNTVKSYCRRNGDMDQETVTEESATEDKQVCPRCHKPVISVPGRRTRIFCSSTCRAAYWRVMAMPVGGQRKCVGCGSPLGGNDREKKYCSHACYIDHRFGGARHNERIV